MVELEHGAEDEADREALFQKALYDAVVNGVEPVKATRLLHDLRQLLERAL
jgi:hypothetical protein